MGAIGSSPLWTRIISRLSIFLSDHPSEGPPGGLPRSGSGLATAQRNRAQHDRAQAQLSTAQHSTAQHRRRRRSWQRHGKS
ncbi:hypothetical protein FHJ30_09600 [Arthrobacter sp. BB-1]|nr:hypothetical protein FHJ30_09600 [Arthrobacter sp. BB-1]